MRSTGDYEEELPKVSPTNGRELQKRFQAPGASGGPVAPDTEQRIADVRNSGGEKLPESERNFFETRMNQDFGAVRIHTRSDAAGASRDVNARAFTVGRDIVFGEGEYKPGTPDGRRLMAHELTHVVQQSGGQQRIQRDTTATKEKSQDDMAMAGVSNRMAGEAMPIYIIEETAVGDFGISSATINGMSIKGFSVRHILRKVWQLHVMLKVVPGANPTGYPFINYIFQKLGFVKPPSTKTDGIGFFQAYNGVNHVFETFGLQSPQLQNPIQSIGEDPISNVSLYGNEQANFESAGGQPPMRSIVILNQVSGELVNIAAPDMATLLNDTARAEDLKRIQQYLPSLKQ